tara:strand:- start:214 stop:486 length:273 start_codon:yes stop_codon:yes gene_type:complete
MILGFMPQGISGGSSVAGGGEISSAPVGHGLTRDETTTPSDSLLGGTSHMSKSSLSLSGLDGDVSTRDGGRANEDGSIGACIVGIIVVIE